jgi:hypothetical protein
MSHYQLQTPVAFIIFNRPDRTAKVFEAIRQARPPMLLVAADGPRVDRIGEAEKCAETRSIIDRVDWPCEVLTNYSDINMGMKHREATAFSWVFEIVEEAILLEDDCLPHPTFFPYCEEMLRHYRYDQRIMTISGDNTPLGNSRNRQTQNSYYFSIYPRTWGWATWRRAWQHYDIEMKQWPSIRDEKWLEDILRNSGEVKYWKSTFQSGYDGFNTWDYQWVLCCWLRNALSIIPTNNLITNLGFDQHGTNTTEINDPRSLVPTQAMQFPLQHPPFMIPDRQADRFTRHHVYMLPNSFLVRAKRKINNSKPFETLKNT